MQQRDGAMHQGKNFRAAEILLLAANYVLLQNRFFTIGYHGNMMTIAGGWQKNQHTEGQAKHKLYAIEVFFKVSW